MSQTTLSNTDLKALRQSLRDFDFAEVMNILGWNRASGRRSITADGQNFTLKPIAQLGGVQVIEVTGGQEPDTLPVHTTRRKVSDEVLKTAREHLLIFVNRARTQSHWYWVKRALDGDRRRVQPRTHTYVKGQPDDVFVSKLAGLFVNLADLNESGDLSVTEAAQRLSNALDSEAVVKRFYNEFRTIREDFASQIAGIPDDRDRAWYASVLLNRLMFIYFLQGKGFIGKPTSSSDGNRQYLQAHLAASKKRGSDRYYSEFLHALFFDAFAAPEAQRSPTTEALVGQIPYLSGSLFLKHGIELKYPDIAIPDRAFTQVLDLFGRYTWNLSDQDKHAGGLDPDVLGHIFEKYINQKGFGAYYTRPEITEYLCEQTVRRLVLDRIKAMRPSESHLHGSLGDALIGADAALVRALLTGPQGLHTLSLVDPACGSGAFLVAALKTLLDIYSALMARIDVFNDADLLAWRADLQGAHRSYHYNLKKKIITDNLYGVDIMEEAAEIAKLRLFLSLVSSANTLDDLEPLPNIDFNILTGNSLIGLLEVDERAYNAQRGSARGAAMTPLLGVGTVTYQQIVERRLSLLTKYKQARQLDRQKLTELRDEIEQQRQEAYLTLDTLLHKKFHDLDIKFEQVTWDAAKKKEGRNTKRALTLADITALKPFHWAFEFAEVMARGGFDAVIANPPWDVVKPNGKEFLESFSETVSKNKMTIKDFEKEKDKLLADEAIRAEWLAYQSAFPHVSAFYRSAPQFRHQTSTVNGRKTGSDLNLYKLFLEQSFNLLRDDGECGIVIPSGVYTDLGAKGLRELLFDSTEMTGLFCFENRKMIFENVDSRFKFVVLSFRKGGQTTEFPAAFMRHDVAELQDFPGGVGMTLSVDAVKRLSPDSLSVMEFKAEVDAELAEKMLRFPLLGEQLEGTWNLKLGTEFHMTNDSGLFRTEAGPGRLPLYEGKMIHQFRHDFAGPRYWVDTTEGRKGVLGRERDTGQKLDYQGYRLGFRDIARNTDSRTLISTVIPPAFHGNKIPTTEGLDGLDNLVLAAIFNSFVMDWVIRQKVTTTINFFYIYQLPVPRLSAADPEFRPLVTAAARLICTTPEFDDLARESGLRDHKDGVTDESGRAALRAELDGRIAHLYGLTEAEFTRILGTFPLIDQSVKDAALSAYRALV
ncbi:Eco57I restriction-modification methylase domain-containing protein [Deinococcus sp.]|uniref:Eco57I restriction-modification methylase domain-containing protein n=1 Tax=Deinococcus sp. TaxID=47478 RepID=UPI003918762D